MTMPTELQNILKTWGLSGQEDERKVNQMIGDGIDTFIKADSDILSRISEGPPLDAPVYRWMEEWDYPETIKATLTGTTLALDTTQTVMGNTGGDLTDTFWQMVLRDRAILRRQSDGLLIQMTTDVSSGEATVQAYGQTALGASQNDSSAVDYDIESEPWTDYDDADYFRALDRDWEKVGAQIFAESFDIGKTRDNLSMRKIEERGEQLAALIRKLRRRLAKAVVRSHPQYTGGAYVFSDSNERATMSGLDWWPTKIQDDESNTAIYVNLDGKAPMASDFNDLCRNMHLTEGTNFNKGRWAVLGHPTMLKYVRRWDQSLVRTTRDEDVAGRAIKQIENDEGKVFDLIPDVFVPKGKFWVLDLSRVAFGYFKNDKLDRKEIPTKGRYRRWLISFQAYGCVLRMKRQSMGTLYGGPTS